VTEIIPELDFHLHVPNQRSTFELSNAKQIVDTRQDGRQGGLAVFIRFATVTLSAAMEAKAVWQAGVETALGTGGFAGSFNR